MPRKGIYTRDYGGGSYGRPHAVRVSKEKLRSFKCLECEKTSLMSLVQATRVAVNRCFKCGGSVEETKTSKKRTLNREAIVKERRDPNTVTPYVCPGCDACFADENAKIYHASVSKDARCLNSYVSKGMTTICGQVFLKETIHVHDFGDGYCVCGINLFGVFVNQIRKFETKEEAEDFVADVEIGDVEKGLV
jgi:hypothetical protein